MDNTPFIARSQQLAHLRDRLSTAIEGHGGVFFISGEAGSGKTTLVNEFSRRAQEEYQDLAVAVGQCNTQTGIGDAHLPFREIMAQLTGDVDFKLAQKAITEENASRLQKMLVLSGQALVDVGPDLIGIFVPGIGLATRLGAFVAEKAGWLDKLEKLAKKPAAKTSESGLQESQIFEQYAKVICRLSKEHPLLLLLDDMHWGDAASISLLFHLARRIGEHRILILVTYRSAEVAIGRAGERHPLEKILAELKRYYGDVCLDLDQVVEDEGRYFVNAFLESEPNLLGDDFSQKLYHHTGGHPLFTIELLRNMQERSDLVFDEQGRWVQSKNLDWEKLPKRVEGVIEERIGRLQDELRQMLTVGSVQGENFTAEVIARVQQAEAGGLIRRLSGELERQHRLVNAEGVKRLDPGGRRLSLYRFQHNLFRTYLYNELGEAERAYLHEDVGNALEALYEEQAEEIAVQLAYHFEAAGLEEKARHYMQKAGEQAASRFANQEALKYFARALDLTPANEFEKRYELVSLSEQIYGLSGEREVQSSNLDILHELARKLDDQHKQAEVALLQASYQQAISDYPAAITAASEALRIGEITQNQKIQARGHFALAEAALRTGNYDLAAEQWELSLAISRTAGLRREESGCLRGLGVVANDRCDIKASMHYYEEALKISREINDNIGASKALNNLGLSYGEQNELVKARDCFSQALKIFQEIGDRQREAVILGNLGVVSATHGDLQSARSYFDQSMLISRQVGDRDAEIRMLSNLGNIAAETGDLPAAREYVAQALHLDEEIGSKVQHTKDLNSMGLIYADMGDYSTAEDYLIKSLELARELKIPDYEAMALVKLGRLHDGIGDFETAKAYFEDVTNIIREIGEDQGDFGLQAYRGLLLHHLGMNEEARETLLKEAQFAHEAIDVETEAGTLTRLGNVLIALGYPNEAKTAFQQSLTLREQMDQTFKATESMSGLAKIALIENKPLESLEWVDKILDFTRQHSIDGTDDPVQIYLRCYQTLIVNQDPRTDEVLRKAHTILMNRTKSIKDVRLRKFFLEKLVVNCEVLKAFEKLDK